MCGTCNGNTNGGASAAAADPPSQSTADGVYPTQGQPKTSPYQSVQDYLSNVNNFKIIESTLREGEQFANAFFDTETKLKIAKALGTQISPDNGEWITDELDRQLRS